MKDMSNNRNHSAFPIPVTCNTTGIYTSYDANGGDTIGGLTKREYFAAKAMEGLATNWSKSNIEIATNAVEIADALLAELEK